MAGAERHLQMEGCLENNISVQALVRLVRCDVGKDRRVAESKGPLRLQ